MNKDLFKKFMNQAVQKGFAYNLSSENLKNAKTHKEMSQSNKPSQKD